MSRVSTYLNFQNRTEEAFLYYQSIFGGEFIGGIRRFSDIPPSPDVPPVHSGLANLVLHVALEITGGHILMGSDAPAEFGFRVTQGNNYYIHIDTDSRVEADRLFSALSSGGRVTQEMEEMFWGAYYGSCTDKFGMQWMFNCVV